ncbi:hypothetical protein BJV82DRAFT_627952 [Fennellomyces sp. T-0311]|nr:hypothetical protein BJV82DRAFT_627952 [Fennellomyces sp. T-0311]
MHPKSVFSRFRHKMSTAIEDCKNLIRTERRGSLAQMMIMTTTLSLQQQPMLSDDNSSHSDDPMQEDEYLPPPHQQVMGRRRSSSCNMLTNASIQNASFDVHMLYKIKKSRSARKLTNFFGEQTPDDICIAEIRREGLKALLQSKIPVCYFLYHLLQEISSENLFFFTELEQYETFSYLTSVQQLATAQHIYDTYLSPNSHFEVNIDERIRRAVLTALQQKRPEHCFDPAKAAVYALLESSFMRFIDSAIWNDMVDQCGGETNTFFFHDLTREAAVNTLLRFIEQQHAILYTNPHTDAPLSMCMKTAKKRHELTKAMVHEFCKTVVGVEFTYYNVWDNEDEEDEEDIKYMSPSYSSTFSLSSLATSNMSRASSMAQIAPNTTTSRPGSHLMQALKRPRQMVEAFEFFARKKK